MKNYFFLVLSVFLLTTSCSNENFADPELLSGTIWRSSNNVPQNDWMDDNIYVEAHFVSTTTVEFSFKNNMGDIEIEDGWSYMISENTIKIYQTEYPDDDDYLTGEFDKKTLSITSSPGFGESFTILLTKK